MRKILFNALCLTFFLFSLSAQEQNSPDTDLNKPYETPTISRLVNENIYLANKNFRWKYFDYSFLNISLFTNPHDFFKTDFFRFSSPFIYVNLLSFYTFDYPMNAKKSRFYSYLFYLATPGLRFPLLSGKNFDLSLGLDYYWPLNFRQGEKDSVYYATTTLIEGAKTTYKNSPQILDYGLILKLYAFKYLGISLCGGYRNQLTKWYGTDRGTMIYSNDISGIYFGLSLSWNLYNRTNKGLEDWQKCKSENTFPAYSGFLSSYPGSHYEIEALQRKEDACYFAAVNGNDSDCNLYLREYSNGKYVGNIRQVLDSHEAECYAVAVAGNINECDTYLQRYPNGKYTENVKKLRIEKQDRMETDCYNKAVNGSINDCDLYLTTYPDGKYKAAVMAEKNNKIETDLYEYAKNEEDYVQCDVYLKYYPGGRYAAEITRLRKEKYEKAEEDSYHVVLSGNYKECEKYMNAFPYGKHFHEVNLFCEKMKYDKNSPTQGLELVNPEVSKIELPKNKFSEKADFTYDVVVTAQLGNTVYVNAITSPKIANEFGSLPYSDKLIIYSSFGKPNTRMDITLMKGGFKYANKIWYPTSDKNAVIICTGDIIKGYNVRYTNIKSKP